MASDSSIIPLWIKLIASAWLIILIPSYLIYYQLENFLWFSNIAFILTVTGMWLGSRLLISMQAVAVTLPETGWILGFLWQIITGESLIGLTDYMFDSEIPLFIRGLSLYHLWLPPLIIYCVYRLGYDKRALGYQAVVGITVLLVSYLFTTPEENINWVHTVQEESIAWIHPHLYLVFMMIIFIVVIYIPTHLVLRRLFSTAT